MEEFKGNTDNPWCNACKEKDCLVSTDGTCNMIRKYLETVNSDMKTLKGKIKKPEFMVDHGLGYEDLENYAI